MNKFWLLLFPALAVVSLLVFPNPVVADDLMIGAVIHRFTGDPECIVLDPEAGKVVIRENVRPNDVYTIRQFITNHCDRNINVGITLDSPGVHYIEAFTDDDGVFMLSPDETITAHATVTFGNDTPAEFSAKDVRFKVSRPE